MWKLNVIDIYQCKNMSGYEKYSEKNPIASNCPEWRIQSSHETRIMNNCNINLNHSQQKF